MRRLFWLALGAVLGAWVMHRFTRLARNFTPQGVAARAVGFGDRLRSYAAEIRTEMNTREAELWSVLGADTLQDGAVPQPRSGQGPPAGPAGRTSGRTPNGKFLDDDKDGH